MSIKLPRLRTSDGAPAYPKERPSRHIGLITAPRDWGAVAKCPHCPKTDIVRRSKKQVTCGSYNCRRLQNNLSPAAKRLQRLAHAAAEARPVLQSIPQQSPLA